MDARRRRACAGAFAAAVAGIALPAPRADATVLHRERSLYRNIVIYEEDGLRCMAFGRNRNARQSCVSLADPDTLVFNYARMTMGALYLLPEPRSILIVGLGGGTLATAFQRLFPAASLDAVEVDAAVVRM